jgi:hypothetical protein
MTILSRRRGHSAYSFLVVPAAEPLARLAPALSGLTEEEVGSGEGER